MEKEELQQIINAAAQAVAAPLMERINTLESRLKAIEPTKEDEAVVDWGAWGKAAKGLWGDDYKIG